MTRTAISPFCGSATNRYLTTYELSGVCEDYLEGFDDCAKFLGLCVRTLSPERHVSGLSTAIRLSSTSCQMNEGFDAGDRQQEESVRLVRFPSPRDGFDEKPPNSSSPFGANHMCGRVSRRPPIAQRREHGEFLTAQSGRLSGCPAQHARSCRSRRLPRKRRSSTRRSRSRMVTPWFSVIRVSSDHT